MSNQNNKENNHPFARKSLDEIPPANQLGVLFMDCVYDMPEHTHAMLVEDLVEKWAFPLMKTKGTA